MSGEYPDEVERLMAEAARREFDDEYQQVWRDDRRLRAFTARLTGDGITLVCPVCERVAVEDRSGLLTLGQQLDAARRHLRDEHPGTEALV